MNRIYRVAYLVSHPIQYQAPLLRSLAQHPNIDLTVFFLSDYSTRSYFDQGFGTDTQWDVPLIEGYRSRFLPNVGGSQHVSFWSPWVYGITRSLKEQPFDALWIHGYAHQANLRALAVAKRLGLKTLLRGESHLTSHQRSPIKEWFRERVLPWLFDAVDGFLAIGTLNHEYYVHYGVSTRKIFPMPYAVDNQFFQREIEKVRSDRENFRKDLGIEPGHTVILFASKFQKRKRPMDLLQAYFRLSSQLPKTQPEPYLIFIGEGEEASRLHAETIKHHCKRVKFEGFKNQTELPRYYDLCDVFVLPSEHEPWGLVINEVMSAGKPVIVSDQVGAGQDLVQDGSNGYIFPVGNISMLAERLMSLIMRPEQMEHMGVESKRRISEWSFDADASGLLEALDFVTHRG